MLVTTYYPVKDVVEAPTPVLTTVKDIGIQSGSVVNGATIQTVDARRLHGYLQSGAKFSDWIKDRITTYGFVDGVDFTTIQNTASESSEAVLNGGQNRIDYHVSLDMAKELAMVERTDKGREARKYFIECEKKLLQGAKQVAVIPNFDDPVDLPTFPILRFLALSLVLV